MTIDIFKMVFPGVRSRRIVEEIKSAKVGRYFKVIIKLFSFMLPVITYISHLRNGKNHFHFHDINQGLKQQAVKESLVSNESLFRIAEAYSKAKKILSDHNQKWRNGGEWEGIVANVFKELDMALEKRDISGMRELFLDFARTKISLGLSLFGDVPKNFQEKLDLLNSFNATYYVWRHLTQLSESSIPIPVVAGNPIGISAENGVIIIPSFRHSYYAERISCLLDGFNEATVLEIGGGYGGMALKLMAIGKKRIRWIDVDLPEVCALSAYFLMANCPEKNFLLYGEDDLTIENLQRADIIIIPTFAIEDVPSESVSLIFNSHSLTEMDYSTVKDYINEIDRISNKFFLHYNHERKTVYSTSSGKTKYFVNLNKPEYELPKKKWLKLYRQPEVIQNCRPGTGEYFEYLYLKK